MRKQSIRKSAILFLIFTTACYALGQSKAKKLDNYFSALAENRQFSGNVLVAENGKIIYEKSFGYADFTSKTRNTKNILFPIASITKIITATAILQQVEQGRLQISDPVIKYLPDFPYPTITIRHLLSHTSGLPPYNAFFDPVRNAQPDKVFTNEDFITGLIANKKPLVYQPGEKGNYDNINYIILALILEKVTGLKFSNYIEKYILKPAGMNNTSFFPLPLQYNSPKKLNNFAFPHLYLHLYSETPVRSNTIPYISSYWHAYSFAGFGDYVSNTHDLLKFDEACYNGKFLRESTLKEAFMPVKLNDGSTSPGEFGLGWEIEKDASLGKVVYHSGAATGLSSVLLRNITKHQTIILFDNTHYNAHDDASAALKILNSVEVPHPKKSLAREYGKLLVSEGDEAARKTLERLKKDTANYELSEDEFNSLGYDLMGNSNPYHLPEEHKYKEALEVFKLNVELFPASWNVYDSYGEALLKTGNKEEAIKMYQKSIELNPKNENGKKILEQLNK